MKFTNETLIQIYLDGSFTEEAQAEFDQLMREDSVFAEQVTNAVAQRLGPAPQSLVDGVAARLDGKMDGVWQQYKPSPFKRVAKSVAKAALVVATATGLVWGWKQVGPSVLSSVGYGNTSSQQVQTPPQVESSSPNADSSLSRSGVKEAKSKPSHTALKKTSLASTHSNLSVSVGSKTKGVPVPVGAPSQVGSNPALDSVESSLKKSSISDNVAPQNQPIRLPAKGSNSTVGAGVGRGGISQEGDGIRVSIETQKTQKVMVTVLDSNGLLIRHLYQGVWTAGDHLVDWDRKDELGNPVLPGNYKVVVNADGKTMSGVVTIQPNK